MNPFFSRVCGWALCSAAVSPPEQEVETGGARARNSSARAGSTLGGPQRHPHLPLAGLHNRSSLTDITLLFSAECS